MHPRGERRVQQLYQQVLASRIIQRRYRGYLARKRVNSMKFELIVVYVQSFIRMFLAKSQKLRLKQEKFSVVVQKHLRRYLAKKVYFELRSQAYDLMVLNKILMIQRRARIYIKRVQQIMIMKNQRANII